MMRIGNHLFDTENETYVMGILNVTPDSFSDGGSWIDMNAALYHVQEMIAEGAAIIDVGGESTRPGASPISEEEEIERTAPMIEEIKRRFDIPVSIDTYKSNVAYAAISAGADMVNDVFGLKYDPSMAGLIADAKVACCLMHTRSDEEGAVYIDEPDYMDVDTFMDALISDLAGSIQIARNAGIADDKIILDPGVGFAKTFEQNLAAIRQVDRLTELRYPILLGTSRKSVIGQSLGLPVDQREEGTMVTTVFAVQQGCSFVRVHDVRSNIRAIRMSQTIMRGKEV